MKTPFATTVLFAAGMAVLGAALLVPACAKADEGNVPTAPQVVLCMQAKEGVTPDGALQACAKGYTRMCHGGYDLGQVIVNVTKEPYWVAAEVTCKPGIQL